MGESFKMPTASWPLPKSLTGVSPVTRPNQKYTGKGNHREAFQHSHTDTSQGHINDSIPAISILRVSILNFYAL